MVAFPMLLQAQNPNLLSPTAQLLDQRLGDLKGGLLLVVDGPKGEWKTKVDALNADPDWVDLDIPVSYYGSKASEVDLLLRQKYQAGPRPQWVLFAEGGRAVANGGVPPDAKALSKAAEAGGINSQLQLLREFARRNPDHLEARGNLLGMLNRKAGKKTQVKFGGKVDPLRPSDEPFDFVKYRKERDEKEETKALETKDEKPSQLLVAEEDQAFWGEYADLALRCFRSGDWIEMESWGLIPDEEAVHSPTVQELCRSAVPEVERALGRNPGSWDLWRLWLGLTRTYGGKPIRPLLDALQPLPTLSRGSWPPYAVRDAYVKDARKRKDWSGIRDLLLPQIERSRLWEASSTRVSSVLKVNGKLQEEPETGDYWRTTLEPLVEALLWLGDPGQADELVREQFGKHPWAGLPRRAAALALRCHQPNLASQWGALESGR
jgi:hypothetical protein